MVPKAVFNGKDRMSKQPTQYLSACCSRQMANVGIADRLMGDGEEERLKKDRGHYQRLSEELGHYQRLSEELGR